MTHTTPNRHFASFVTTVAAVGLFAAACGKPQLASIEVSPNANMSVNSTQQFTAVGRDTKGNIFDITPSWAVVADGGTINDNGLFTAGSVPGQFPVRATSDGISGQATVVVTPAPVKPLPGVATITIEQVKSDSLSAGTTRQYTAVARDSAGNVVDVSPTWSVVSGGGTITSEGLFTAGDSSGIFQNTIRASSGAVEAFTSVTVASSAAALATMGEVVHFGFDESDLTDSARNALDAKVRVLGTNPDMRITIVGHTDALGSAEYNLALGTRRAEAVKAYLVSAGVDATRVTVETRGESEPMATGISDEARAQNRRGTFVIGNADTAAKD